MITINWETILYLSIGAIIGFIPSIVLFIINLNKEKSFKKKEIIANLLELLPQMHIRRFQRDSDEFAIHYWKTRAGRETEPLYYEQDQKELDRFKNSFQITFEKDLETYASLIKNYSLFEVFCGKNDEMEKLINHLLNYKYNFPDITQYGIGELRQMNLERAIRDVDSQSDTSTTVDKIFKILKSLLE